MRQDIISQMEANLYDTSWCKNDFPYDLKILEEQTEPFFWMVRKCGTSICSVGSLQMLAIMKNQASRFHVFRDKYAYISNFMYHADDSSAKFFYFDGLSLNQIDKLDVLKIYDSLFSEVYEFMKREYVSEYEICNEPLEIKYASEDTKKIMDVALEFADEMHDDSLKNCLEHLSNYLRIAVNQYILIGHDFEQLCFTFSEYINDECKMQGGVICSQGEKGNRWQIHT